MLTLIFPEIIQCMSEHYKVCDDRETILLNSVHYGVPQVRKRVILIGVRKDLEFEPKDIYNAINKTHYSPEMESKKETKELKKYLTVKDAISDLPSLMPGEGLGEVNHTPRLKGYLSKVRSKTFDKLYNHEARKHQRAHCRRRTPRCQSIPTSFQHERSSPPAVDRTCRHHRRTPQSISAHCLLPRWHTWSGRPGDCHCQHDQ